MGCMLLSNTDTKQKLSMKQIMSHIGLTLFKKYAVLWLVPLTLTAQQQKAEK